MRMTAKSRSARCKIAKTAPSVNRMRAVGQKRQLSQVIAMASEKVRPLWPGMTCRSEAWW